MYFTTCTLNSDLRKIRLAQNLTFPPLPISGTVGIYRGTEVSSVQEFKKKHIGTYFAKNERLKCYCLICL
jgi:hypothetical protein